MDDMHPVQLLVEDDLRRSRLTVFFRLLLAIPHFVWLFLWGIAVFFAAIVNWFITLAAGRPPASLHQFMSSYVRYVTHLSAYLVLAANPYPGFVGEEGEYPIDVTLPPPGPQERWKTLLRIFLAVPALLVAGTLGGAGALSASYGRRGRTSSAGSAGALAAVCGFLGWFAVLARGRMPKGLRDGGAYGVGYSAQALAYLLLVTDRYPNADPTALLATVERPPQHPVHLVGDAHDLRRSRVLVFFRLPLVIPHLVWLALWTVAAVLAGILNWFATLFAGTPPRAFHRFLSAYVRYTLHVYAFAYLAANPFPGFVGESGRYPLDVVLPERQRQSRWLTGFRIFLAIPALLVSGVLGWALTVAAILTWFVALIRGAAPWGLRNLSAYALRYAAQVNAYVYLLTDRYPHASPLEAAWALAAYLLWRSSVPALHLPRLDPRAYFSARQLARAASYSRGVRLLWFLATLAQLAALALFARFGVRWARESAAGRMGTGMLLGMLGFALVWAVQLPFAVLEIWWARRHGLSTASYVAVTFGNWLALGGTFVFLCVALAIVMGLAGVVGNWWWLPAAPCFAGLVLLFSFVTPYLLGGQRLTDPDLRAATARLERIEHVRRVPVKILTGMKEPNAVATGLGPSRRVFLWDTIVEPPFTHREVKVVIAHELGHLAHNHIWRNVGWYALFAFPGAFLVAAGTRRRGGMRNPEAVPLSLLILVALNLVALPLQNAVTRHMEAEADWSALRATRDPAGATALFKRFVPTTLGQPDPPTWDYVLLENHPTIIQRLAMVQAWRRYAASDAQSP